MNETTAAPIAPPADRAAIRTELEKTRGEFRDLVARIDESHWKARSGNPGWTCGQLAWHIAASPAFIVGLIENARKGKGQNPPSFLLGPVFKASEFRVKFLSRKATQQSVLADYDAGMQRMLGVLDTLDDEDFAKVTTNFGQTKAIEEQFHVPAAHFEEHSAEIRSGLASG